ncbi:MAG: VWA domain-containing protein, partial [Hymenobacteraceae bacterium]|nr:VWA domain-containing protein [Hymenobacteraceae bacterium]MDX5397114.1 VWA domain-containing protein [Hymenobacteraceae bacterium]MDX5513192.1 VWA domain-containing protein [Hymenobacteraceae bacterium]
MDQFKILLSASPWLIVACLAAGALYAWLLYSKKTPWSAKVNYALAALRFVVVSFLCFLLLGPYLRQITQTEEKPTVVFAVDNSQSVGLFTDSAQLNALTQQLEQVKEALQKEDINTEIRTFELNQQPTQLTQLRFDQQTTNLDQLLTHVRDEYENQNLAGVVLLSDGIINQGRSPVNANYTFPILPVALGDTIPKHDLSIPSLLYNKVAYSGNRFPVVAEVRNEGFTSGTATVLLKEGAKVLERKSITLKQNVKEQRVEFLLTADAPGKKHYEVVLEPLNGEFTTLNNSKHAYIDIIKGKINVLIA